MNNSTNIGDIWLVAMPTLLKKYDNSFDTALQIRPFLIVDDGKGVLIEENPDYLALKITTKNNRIKKVKEIKNWKELGLKKKSYIRIEIPERIEREQLINKISQLPKEQFLECYREILNLFNVDLIKIMSECKA